MLSLRSSPNPPPPPTPPLPQLNSFRRPHMRGFHVSWISFFLAFFCWFSITPLLSTIKEPEPVGIGISKEDIWTR